MSRRLAGPRLTVGKKLIMSPTPCVVGGIVMSGRVRRADLRSGGNPRQQRLGPAQRRSSTRGARGHGEIARIRSPYGPFGPPGGHLIYPSQASQRHVAASLVVTFVTDVTAESGSGGRYRDHRSASSSRW